MVDFVQPNQLLLPEDKQERVHKLEPLAEVEDIHGEGEETNRGRVSRLTATVRVPTGEAIVEIRANKDTHQHDEGENGHETVVEEGKGLQERGGLSVLHVQRQQIQRGQVDHMD